MTEDYTRMANYYSNIVQHDNQYQLVQSMTGPEESQHITMVRDVKDLLQCERDDIQKMMKNERGENE